jgi:prepilin-type N-terminal cleavage/methylation domain-containing protein
MTMARDRGRADAGFSLVEVLIATVLLSVGALALAGAVAQSARQLAGSQDQLIASQRASEAAESVFKARDTRVLTWAQIRNVQGFSGADNGVFLDGARPVRDPGPDGLVNTADDGAAVQVVRPGPDGLLGTADDENVALFGFTREIEIRDLGPSLRQLRIIVTYRSAQGPTQFILTTFISAYA